MGRTKSHVSNNIRTLRFQHGEMTQQALAQKVGVARQTIIAIEQGKFCPSLETALRMEVLFDIPVSEIFSLQDQP